jgi:hypothetical protein
VLSIEELVATYRATALSWDSLQSDPTKANRVFRDLHSIYKNLRSSEAGRSGLTALMDDPSVAVRLMAVAHSLAWMPEKAEGVLRAIEDDRNAGLHSVSAKYTLREFRAGRLSHNW